MHEYPLNCENKPDKANSLEAEIQVFGVDGVLPDVRMKVFLLFVNLDVVQSEFLRRRGVCSDIHQSLLRKKCQRAVSQYHSQLQGANVNNAQALLVSNKHVGTGLHVKIRKRLNAGEVLASRNVLDLNLLFHKLRTTIYEFYSWRVVNHCNDLARLIFEGSPHSLSIEVRFVNHSMLEFWFCRYFILLNSYKN